MSIVKYTNKKTGVVSWYESTSHYDPETKQSRPVRKYLGREDPVTGELIPSSGKRGRRNGDTLSKNDDPQSSPNDDAMNAMQSKYEKKISSLEALVSEQKATIRKLESEKSSIVKKLSDLLNTITD
ncbi:MAG: hypothetical protein ACI35P_11880 [Bacillus sp. (in: firmicutes)]